jgi:hypothetical protein
MISLTVELMRLRLDSSAALGVALRKLQAIERHVVEIVGERLVLKRKARLGK